MAKIELFFLKKTLVEAIVAKRCRKKGPKNQVFEEKNSQGRWKSKKKAIRDGGKQRKRLSETVEVKKFWGVAYKPGF